MRANILEHPYCILLAHIYSETELSARSHIEKVEKQLKYACISVY